jgi:hypothetical protein
MAMNQFSLSRSVKAKAITPLVTQAFGELAAEIQAAIEALAAWTESAVVDRDSSHVGSGPVGLPAAAVARPA